MIPTTDEHKISRWIILNIVVLLAVAALVVFFYFGNLTPIERGFFCDDESIGYPYKESTVSNSALYSVGILSALIIIFTTEFFMRRKSSSSELQDVYLRERRIPVYMQYMYIYTYAFLFGLCITEVATEFIKYTLGRLRPNFLDSCQPDFDCSSAPNSHAYVLNYTCTSSNVERSVDSRLSFPSGHSSTATYTMLFCVFYLQKRLIFPYSKPLKMVFQCLLLLFAAFTCISRIGDNKHHWSDVCGGIILGFAVCLSMFSILLSKQHVREDGQVIDGESYTMKGTQS